ncbi:type 1 glutamine amidotransferase [Corynebacterium evansiae]|uniref:Lipid II isoglutaminyl synthase (glutamine-hydrolyzing) subunit GatD n=1 Tax=Corynebacterium evansiae TaxID=2913499 RepID=A0A9X3REH3_9CORY|nr:glutamine amidotransferase [Corynebacterium evansiae]MCZ9288620.1 glutamine amidotransferase [Corynebacterium evansiae]
MNAELNIGLILPDVLGTYGDDGNALVLRQRARMRGISAEIHPIHLGEPVPESLDVYTVGGGEDTAQVLAAEHLISDGGISRAVAAGRPVLAICAGLQVFGRSFTSHGRTIEGLGLIDATTSQLAERMIGEIASTPAASAVTGGAGLTEPLTGFANHMGATILGEDAEPLGRLTRGTGNTDSHGAEAAGLSGEDAHRQTRAEGAVQGSVVATYMHGPVLARNPQLADWLLARAMGVSLNELPEFQGELAKQLEREVASLRKERL